MPEPLVKFLTYVFLALLYLFFLRVLRAVWIELREPRATAPVPEPAGAGPASPPPDPVPPASPPPHPAPPHPPPPRKARRRNRKDRAERLRIVEPATRKGQGFTLGEELTVGRAPTCGVSLPDDTFISQLHARLFRRDQELWIEDLGSTNGTYLNDHRVSGPALIHEGDRVRVGQTVLEVTR